MDWQAAFIARAEAAYTKTWWVNAPQKDAAGNPITLPYATLLDVTELRGQTLNDWDLEFARVQIDVWGLTYAQVQTGMAALINALVPGNTSNGHTFQRADIALGPRDVGGEREGDTIIYRKSADLVIAHTATA
jgi:hypothetical protein